jgi:hypothetical protein
MILVYPDILNSVPPPCLIRPLHPLFFIQFTTTKLSFLVSLNLIICIALGIYIELNEIIQPSYYLQSD